MEMLTLFYILTTSEKEREAIRKIQHFCHHLKTGGVSPGNLNFFEIKFQQFLSQDGGMMNLKPLPAWLIMQLGT